MVVFINKYCCTSSERMSVVDCLPRLRECRWLIAYLVWGNGCGWSLTSSEGMSVVDRFLVGSTHWVMGIPNTSPSVLALPSKQQQKQCESYSTKLMKLKIRLKLVQGLLTVHCHTERSEILISTSTQSQYKYQCYSYCTLWYRKIWNS